MEMNFLDELGLTRLWGHIISKLATKSDIKHTHSYDDLRNKPFYEGTDFSSILIGDELTVNFYEWGSNVYGAAITGAPKCFTQDVSYKVIWDGIEYTITCSYGGDNEAGNPITSLGSPYGDYSTYPFGIDSYKNASGANEFSIHTNLTYATHTIDILEFGSNFVALDEKFIPDSIARASDLNSKVDKIEGKGLSTNDYTTAEKEKLAGLSSGSKVALSDVQNGKNIDVDNGEATAVNAFIPSVDYINSLSKTVGDANYLKLSGGTLTGRLTLGKGAIAYSCVDNNGTTGYFKFATAVIKDNYLNKRITMDYVARGRQGSLVIGFANASNKDPDLETFIQDGVSTSNIYAVRTGTSTWDFYIQKSEAWDAVDFYTFFNPYVGDTGINWTWSSTVVSSLPTGYKTASIKQSTSGITKTVIYDSGSQTGGTTDAISFTLSSYEFIIIEGTVGSAESRCTMTVCGTGQYQFADNDSYYSFSVTNTGISAKISGTGGGKICRVTGFK